MLDPQQSLAALALQHPQTEVVLRSFQLDLYGSGAQPLAQACEARGVALTVVVVALEEAAAQGADWMLLDPRGLTAYELAEHLFQSHGAFQRRALPGLRALAVHLARVHGTPELRLLSGRLQELESALGTNLAHEEDELLAPLRDGQLPAGPALSRVRAEQREVALLLDQVRDAATGYSAPPEACQSWCALYRDLALLEADVLRRLHLEANVLLPMLVP